MQNDINPIKPFFVKITAFIIAICFIFFWSNARADNWKYEKKIIQTLQDPQFLELLKRPMKNSLMVIEVDDLIVMPQSAMFAYNSPYRWFVDDLINLSRNNRKYLEIIANWYQSRKLVLVENAWPNHIKQFIQSGAAVYGLCKNKLPLNNFLQFRSFEIKNLGINFSQDSRYFVMKEIGPYKAEFYNSIIFTSKFDSAKILDEFLKKSGVVPSELIFISSDKKVLNSVVKMMRKYKTKVIAVHYLGFQNMNKNINESVILLQQKILIKQKKWLEDQEAEELIKQSSAS